MNNDDNNPNLLKEYYVTFVIKELPGSKSKKNLKKKR